MAVDDFLLRSLTPDQAADVLEVIEDRVGLRSTIVTSQLPVAMWHEALGEPTVADVLLSSPATPLVGGQVQCHGRS